MADDWEAKMDAYDRAQAALKPWLTDEFLSVLIRAARVSIGGDIYEILYFVRECHEWAGKRLPEEQSQQILEGIKCG